MFIGYSIGSAPVVGYHYGAGNHEELKGLLRKSILLMGVIGFCMVLVAQILAAPLSKFTALNNGGVSAAISFLRTFIFKLSAVLILPMLLELDGIWWSDVTAEVFAFVISVLFLAAKRKKYHY